ncbi:zinc-binding dehydrogenase [Nocardia alni]|uniref:zinc-binding dehydrogenase n=1 Tax=Nocardia alni TaxID=2815723 RepID=UPI001C240204|nr:zinc-binding dehydrogenase [Nocardia alni]
MKASVVDGIGAGFTLRDVDIDAPRGSEVLVDVRACGLCHSDLSIATMGLGYEFPIVLGHELAGVVAAVGSDVVGVRAGDHVVGSLLQFCGRCVDCLSGKTFRCRYPEATARGAGEPPRLSMAGTPVGQMNGLGGFAQQALVHERQLAVVPEELPFAVAALLGCGVLTGAGAVLNTAKVQAGESVVVIGCGGVGLNAVNGARLAGAGAIIAIDLQREKLDRARAFGATHTVDAASGDPVAEVTRLTGGADHVFDFVGASAVTRQALEMVGKGGGLYLIGLGADDAVLEVDTVEMLTRQLHVHGVWMGSSTLPRDIPLYASMYLQGRIELDGLVSREIALHEIGKGYEALRDPSVARVVVTDLS